MAKLSKSDMDDIFSTPRHVGFTGLSSKTYGKAYSMSADGVRRIPRKIGEFVTNGKAPRRTKPMKARPSTETYSRWT